MERNGPRTFLWVPENHTVSLGKPQAVFLLMEIILFHQRQAERIWRTGYLRVPNFPTVHGASGETGAGDQYPGNEDATIMHSGWHLYTFGFRRNFQGLVTFDIFKVS